LALFGRRLSEREDGLGIPASENLHRTGIEQRFVGKPVAEVAAAASDLVAGRELAQFDTEICDTGAQRHDHDVSILITIGDVAGR
jgi:hypothetical protein